MVELRGFLAPAELGEEEGAVGLHVHVVRERGSPSVQELQRLREARREAERGELVEEGLAVRRSQLGSGPEVALAEPVLIVLEVLQTDVVKDDALPVLLAVRQAGGWRRHVLGIEVEPREHGVERLRASLRGPRGNEVADVPTFPDVETISVVRLLDAPAVVHRPPAPDGVSETLAVSPARRRPIDLEPLQERRGERVERGVEIAELNRHDEKRGAPAKPPQVRFRRARFEVVPGHPGGAGETHGIAVPLGANVGEQIGRNDGGGTRRLERPKTGIETLGLGGQRLEIELLLRSPGDELIHGAARRVDPVHVVRGLTREDGLRAHTHAVHVGNGPGLLREEPVILAASLEIGASDGGRRLARHSCQVRVVLGDDHEADLWVAAEVAENGVIVEALHVERRPAGRGRGKLEVAIREAQRLGAWLLDAGIVLAQANDGGARGAPRGAIDGGERRAECGPDVPAVGRLPEADVGLELGVAQQSVGAQKSGLDLPLRRPVAGLELAPVCGVEETRDRLGGHRRHASDHLGEAADEGRVEAAQRMARQKEPLHLVLPQTGVAAFGVGLVHQTHPFLLWHDPSRRRRLEPFQPDVDRAGVGASEKLGLDAIKKGSRLEGRSKGLPQRIVEVGGERRPSTIHPGLHAAPEHLQQFLHPEVLERPPEPRLTIVGDGCGGRGGRADVGDGVSRSPGARRGRFGPTRRLEIHVGQRKGPQLALERPNDDDGSLDIVRRDGHPVSVGEDEHFFGRDLDGQREGEDECAGNEPHGTTPFSAEIREAPGTLRGARSHLAEARRGRRPVGRLKMFWFTSRLPYFRENCTWGFRLPTKTPCRWDHGDAPVERPDTIRRRGHSEDA